MIGAGFPSPELVSGVAFDGATGLWVFTLGPVDVAFGERPDIDALDDDWTYYSAQAWAAMAGPLNVDLQLVAS